MEFVGSVRQLFRFGDEHEQAAAAAGGNEPALEIGRHTGRTIGSVYSWGAVGSIVGTFLTGYFLGGIWAADSAMSPAERTTIAEPFSFENHPNPCSLRADL